MTHENHLFLYCVNVFIYQVRIEAYSSPTVEYTRFNVTLLIHGCWISDVMCSDVRQPTIIIFHI